jgi:hypothetical protein
LTTLDRFELKKEILKIMSSLKQFVYVAVAVLCLASAVMCENVDDVSDVQGSLRNEIKLSIVD